jgi:hypothetical protein
VSPELVQLQKDFAELQGQIVGALAMLKLLVGLFAVLCGAIVSLCVYVFLKLSKGHEKLDGRVQKIERWRERVEAR